MTSNAPPASTAEKPPLFGAPDGARRDGARRQAERGDDDELGQDERGQRLHQAPAPVRHGRPDERRQGEREEQHGDVDRGGADEQLEPEHEGRHRDQQRNQQQHEARDRRIGRRRPPAPWSPSRARCARRPRCRRRSRRSWHRWPTGDRITIWTATTASNNASGSCTRYVRTSCPGFWRSTACSVDSRSIGQDHDAGQRRHLAVVGAEPGGADVDGGRRDEDVADLAEQPLGAAGHPLADAVEDRLEPGRGERAPEAADLADRVECVESGATGGLHDDGVRSEV